MTDYIAEKNLPVFQPGVKVKPKACAGSGQRADGILASQDSWESIPATEVFEAMRTAGAGGAHSAWGRRGQSGSALSRAFSDASFCSLNLQLRDKERQMIKERFKVSQGPPCTNGGGSGGGGNRGTEFLVF